MKTTKLNFSAFKKGLPKVSGIFKSTTTLKLRRLAVFVLIFAVLYLLKGFFVAALVNGVPISRYSLVRELEKQGGKDVLESLITQKIIFQEASKKGIKIEPGDIEAEMKIIEDQVKAQGTDLDTVLAMQGQTRSSLENNIKIKIAVEKVLADKLTVSDKEAEDYFNQNKTSFTGKTFADTKSEIIDLLKQQKLSSEYQNWIGEIKNTSKVIYWVNL